MRAFRLTALLLLGALQTHAAKCAAPPEERAVAFLSREVPRWARENHCCSCHNNGDAARALYRAARAGYHVPEHALTATTAWLTRPAQWDHNGGDGPSSDKRLARVAFASALATAVATRSTRNTAALLQAGGRLALDQAPDGSWPLEGEDSICAPASYGRSLATFLARESLLSASPDAFRTSIRRAELYLMRQPIVTVTDASICLLVCGMGQTRAAAERRSRSLFVLGRAQAADGGWGPQLASPPEPFDTALAVLGLVECKDLALARRLIARGREYLISQQQPDGGWVETTRPPGTLSYAQRISTSGWATMALLASRGLQ
jgi:hypothetical protein